MKPSEKNKKKILDALARGRTKHNHTSRKNGKSKIYQRWTAMMGRCYTKSCSGFERYGGRGIMVCKRWRDFKNFLADMGPDVPKGMSLDRINNNGNYEPKNCRWSSWPEQCRNTRRTIFITYEGETLCAKDWARKFGLSSGQLITRRLKMGWSLKDALTTKTISTKSD